MEFFNKVQRWAHKNFYSEIHFYGPVSSGKSTFVEQLKKRSNEAIAAPKTKQIRYTFSDDKFKAELEVCDNGGDAEFRRKWFDALYKTPPLGIIYVSTLSNTKDAIEGLKNILGALKENHLNSTFKPITKAIMVFINKCDEWDNNKNPPETIIERYKEVLSSYKEIGIFPIIRWGSARYYNKCDGMFDKSMEDFYELLFIHEANVPLLPLEVSING